MVWIYSTRRTMDKGLYEDWIQDYHFKYNRTQFKVLSRLNTNKSFFIILCLKLQNLIKKAYAVNRLALLQDLVLIWRYWKQLELMNLLHNDIKT